ncbi:MAG: efflux RND transporter periplasmic adaptor subunit [Burkholderiaceae bacterium]|nr:efflux RND transporter periplasmic adaptor subunit [Burkholderiaceae bacterium]
MNKRPLLLVALIASLGGPSAAVHAAPPASALQTAVVSTLGDRDASAFDGVVEAVRQTVVAAQVAGAIRSLDVKVGDRVKAGQVLARIDARTAEQTAAASDAQVIAARAALDLATRDFDRQKRLFQQRFISQAALDRAEGELKSTQAQVNAQIAQAGATRTQSGLFVVSAPYAGVVSEVPVALGDMAMPGKPLVTLHDPGAMRVTVAVPQTLIARAGLAADGTSQAIRIERPGADGGQPLTPARVQVLPTVDPATHTVQLRLDLPSGTSGLAPGQFARVWLNTGAAASAVPRLSVPLSAIVQRAEMTGLYVIAPSGRPVLRQIRVGRTQADRVEVLSGVSANERVALDPQAAAQVR